MAVKTTIQELRAGSVSRLLPDHGVGTTNKSGREAWMRKVLAEIPAGKRILDAGAGQLQYRDLCSHLDYVSQDFGQYDGQGNQIGLQTESWDNSKLDITSDIAAVPVEDESFDAVMCIEVFEHIPHPTEAVREFARLLRPEGKLIITTPVSSLTHFAPYYFYNGYSRFYFEKVLPEHGFRIREISFNGNYFEYLGQELRRLEVVGEQYTDGYRKPGLGQKLASRLMLKRLSQLSERDRGSDEILSFGIHVLAEKE